MKVVVVNYFENDVIADTFVYESMKLAKKETKEQWNNRIIEKSCDGLELIKERFDDAIFTITDDNGNKEEWIISAPIKVRK